MLKKPQLLTIGIAILLTAVLFLFGRTVPRKKIVVAEQHGPNDGHNHGVTGTFSIDSVLDAAKKQLDADVQLRLQTLEHSISRGDVKDQQLHIYHQLARFWGDSARVFEPYAWYRAEAARLENSEKSLTFAARLFLDNLQVDGDPERRRWKALQAKDLFERSLTINPANDSARVGLGACYLFGDISTAPMEGIAEIRKVVDRDSTNEYAQMMLAKGSLISGQYDKAISRLLTVTRISPQNSEAMLLLADLYERTGDKKSAVAWYKKSLAFYPEEVRKAINERIDLLEK
jgi:tetratricopeptide (TPR) repeat protein